MRSEASRSVHQSGGTPKHGQRHHLRFGRRASTRRPRQLRWSGQTGSRLHDGRQSREVRGERESAQARQPGASPGRCPLVSKVDAPANVITSASGRHAPTRPPRQLRWSGPTVFRFHDKGPSREVRVEPGPTQARQPSASSGRCPLTFRGGRVTNVITTASVCTLRIDVHDNSVARTGGLSARRCATFWRHSR